MCATHEPSDPPPPAGRPAPADVIANLRQPGRLSWKLRRMLANTAIKVTRGQRCCGHAGEPGC